MRYAVATPHTGATQAAEDAFCSGGSAVDAALAAAAVLAVVYPHMCAIGGDAMALVARPDGEVTALIGAGAAPTGLTVDGDAMPWSGPLTITVPGMVDAWGELAMLGARLPWVDHFGTAIAHAREGVEAAPHLARAIAAQRVEFDLAHLGEPLIVQAALARTLERIAERGPRELYEGKTAQRLVEGLQEAGSPMISDDLAAHRTEVTQPLAGPFRGLTVLTTPPPTQGATLLRILERLDGDLVAAFREAAAEREPTLGDPKGDTVAIVAADEDGYAVSLIQSVYGSFGSGVLEPRTGILMHNRGAAFSLDPRSPNLLKPGKRPMHTLMPVLVQDRRMVLGTMGAKAQPQIITQVLLKLLEGATPQEAVAARRITVDGEFVTDDDAAVGHAMAIRDLEAGADPRADGSAAMGVA